MLTLKYIFGCLIGYFLALFLFFTTEFISYPQLQEISNNTLTSSIGESKIILQNSQPQHEASGKGQQKLPIASQQRKSQQKPPPQVSQVILIIIDALRYDYIKRMRFFNQTLTNHPLTTLIKKSIVGNPTMTTQRIESMMTGSQIFTQTNVLDMFLSKKKLTDNLISQLRRANKTVKIFGDDTWTKLFQFDQGNQFVCDSTFNIRDYDACDELIYANLHKFTKIEQDKVKKNSNNQSEILANTQSDSLLIAHFLALDHIGHSTSSITAPEMNQKMQRMSLYLEYLIETASQNTMFIITGDHGMREDGNHGGNSPAEKESLMFTYYKPKKWNSQEKDYNQRVTNFEGSFVSQVDLTATISVLLNLPNPINSIGCPIIEILPQKFEPYLARILYNTLDQYKLLIQHYRKDSETKTNQNSTNKCLSKIISKQEELLLLSPQKQTFKQMMKSKEFIKTEIQLGECLGEKLSMVEPDLLTVWVSLILMAGCSVFLVGKGIYDELKKIVAFDTKERILFLILQVIGWMGSLFTIYFSWYLLRNSSTYLLLLVMFMIIMIPKKGISLGKKIQLILLVLLLIQFQPDKINEYEMNYFNCNMVENIVGFLNSHIPTSPSGHSHLPQQTKQIQLRQLKSLLHIFCVTVWVLFKLKQTLSWGRTQKSLSWGRKSKKQGQKAKQRTKNRIFWNGILRGIIMVLVYLILLMQQLNKNGKLLGINDYKALESVDVLQIVVYMKYMAFLVIIIRWIKKWLCENSSKKPNKQEEKYQQLNNDRDFSVMMTFSIIVGLENFLPLMIYSSIISTVLSSNMQVISSNMQVLSSNMQVLSSNMQVLSSNMQVISSNMQVISSNILRNNMHHMEPPDVFTKTNQPYKKNKLLQPNAQSITIGCKLVLTAVICQQMWWIQGNRYQYSSIDIRKSYIFSVEFNIYLNAVGMVLWFMAPYIVAILAVDRRLLSTVQTGYQPCSLIKKQQTIQEQEEQSLKAKQLSISIPSLSSQTPTQPNSINVDCIQQPQTNTRKLSSLYQSTIIKFIFVFMAGLISSALNLVLNNNKILFTVVYVPLFVLGLFKVFIISALVVGLLVMRKTIN